MYIGNQYCLLFLVSLITVHDAIIAADDMSETSVNASWNQDVHIQFSPQSVEKLWENYLERVKLNISDIQTTDHDYWIILSIEKGYNTIAKIVNVSYEYYSENDAHESDVDSDRIQCLVVYIQGIFLGRTRMKVYTKLATKNSIHDIKDNTTETLEFNQYGNLRLILTDNKNNEIIQDGISQNPDRWKEHPIHLPISIIRKERIVDKLFLVVVYFMVVCANIGMGCKIDLKVIKEVLRRPFAPAIGFCCQFIIMPLMAFGITKAVKLEGGAALGFFASGCAPGGGSSNMYSYLLGGDVSLSVTMTLISIIASLGMIPMWLFTLGRYIDGTAGIHIPFQNIMISLVSILIPVGIGLLIQLKSPKAAKRITKLLKPLFIMIILFMFTAGIYANIYIFSLFTPILMIGACLLPYASFLISGLVAFILRQPRNRIITIAIETGIQNTGIPILLMKFSLPQPDADMSLVSPAAIGMLTPLPLWIAAIVKEIHTRCCKKSEFQEVAQDDNTFNNEGTVVKKDLENSLMTELQEQDSKEKLINESIKDSTNDSINMKNSFSIEKSIETEQAFPIMDSSGNSIHIT